MRTLIVIVFVLSFISGSAQQSVIMAQGTGPGMYISHVVLPKESLYSVARLYNIAPAVLADANGINLQTGLKIGQAVKVPLTGQNFDQQAKKGTDETLVPVYHVVAKSETLFRISTNYNKVPLETLREWNRLSGDIIAAGTPLVIGYLKIKNEQVAALKAGVPALTATPDEAPVDKPMPVSEPVTSVPQKAQPEIKTEIPAEEPVTQPKKTAQVTVPSETIPAAAESQPAITDEKKPEPVIEKRVEKKAAVTLTANPEEGFFAGVFAADASDGKLIENSGEAGTFKSTSGWQNKKYYALINNVTPGTILKITADNKTIYAKVLGSLPEMKENSSLLIRLSNAAASALQKSDSKFSVQISFYQ